MIQPGRIELIDQLRGIAALSVAWFHLTNQYNDWVYSSGSYGWLGVETFFVISGFVIPLSLAGDWHRRGARALPLFMARRIVRIEPPYLASVALVVALNFVAQQVPIFHGRAPVLSVSQILFHAAYLIPFTSYEWLQPVYWTLAFEFAFYLAVAGLIGFLAGARREPVVAGLALLLWLIASRTASPLLGLFAMGCAAFRFHTGRDPWWLTWLTLGSAALAMIFSGALVQALVGLISAAVISNPLLLKGITGRAGQALSGLGTISFSLYLLHVPIGGKIVNLGQRWLVGPTEHLLLSLGSLGVTLLAATLFWLSVERPCIVAAAALARRSTRGKPDQLGLD